MGETKSITINQTCDNGCVAPWADLNHDLLNSVMMQLGVVDFLAFMGVCKSWRSLAVSNRNRFMASRPPMMMSISTNANEKECYLMDFEGRMFKTILPHSAGRTCVGLTCGYLILFGGETHDFWLVNPITRHEFHFPDVPFDVGSTSRIRIRVILVFSHSISGWVFIMADRLNDKIWFSIAGKGAWNHASTSFILDLHVFKGKIYTLHSEGDVGHICEFSIAPKPKLRKIETKNFLNNSFEKFANWSGNLYLIPNRMSEEVHKLDFGEMKWVCCENKKEKLGFFYSTVQHIGVVKPESWLESILYYERYDVGLWLNYANIWYFPHDCLTVDVLDE